MAEDIPAALLTKLAPEMNLSQLKKILSVPSLDDLSQQLSQLNPEQIFGSIQLPGEFSNLANFNMQFGNIKDYLPIKDFLPQLPSPQILDQTIANVTQGLNIPNQLQGLVQSYLGNNFQIPDFSSGQVDIQSVFSGTFSQFASFNTNNFNFAKGQILGNLQGIQGNSNISSLVNSIQSSIPSQFSPKQALDLSSNTNTFNNFINKSSEKSSLNLNNQVKQNAQSYQSSFTGGDNTQVKAGPIPPNSVSPNDFRINAVVTTYSAEQRLGRGGDEWSQKRQSSTSKDGEPNLIEGVSCAVDPSQIPYGSKIVFDNPAIGTRVAMDTGEAVYRQDAARKRGIVKGDNQSSYYPSDPNFSKGSTVGQRTVQAAQSYLGVTEKGSTNTGSQLNPFFQAGGGSQGQPWCAGFVSAVTQQATAGTNTPAPRTMRAYGMEDFAKSGKAEIFRYGEKPLQPGDIITYKYSHTGIVESVNSDGSFTTIEGNTSGRDMDREGQGVFRKFKKNGNTVRNVIRLRDENQQPQQVKTLTVDIYFDTEQSRLNFEKNVLSGGETQEATVQPPKSGVYSQTVTYPSGRKIQAFYPEGYKQLKSRSAENLLKVAENA
jgi:3D (Asp-Asp-Asp) domain-containing protein